MFARTSTAPPPGSSKTIHIIENKADCFAKPKRRNAEIIAFELKGNSAYQIAHQPRGNSPTQYGKDKRQPKARWRRCWRATDPSSNIGSNGHESSMPERE